MCASSDSENEDKSHFYFIGNEMLLYQESIITKQIK